MRRQSEGHREIRVLHPFWFHSSCLPQRPPPTSRLLLADHKLFTPGSGRVWRAPTERRAGVNKCDPHSQGCQGHERAPPMCEEWEATLWGPDRLTGTRASSCCPWSRIHHCYNGPRRSGSLGLLGHQCSCGGSESLGGLRGRALWGERLRDGARREQGLGQV